MNKLIIPRKMIQSDDLVIIPRREYEALVLKQLREFVPTSAEKRALARGRKNFRAGRYVTLQQLRHELDSTRR